MERRKMRTQLVPHISFKNNACEAMKFYQKVFGGKLVLQTFKDFNASQDPSEDDKIMHAMLETENGMTFMAADTPNRMEHHPGTNFSLTLSGDNQEELTAYFQKLSAGGTITMPLEKSMWGDLFGMCIDPFGIGWMVNIATPKA
jgi:PhnB protein